AGPTLADDASPAPETPAAPSRSGLGTTGQGRWLRPDEAAHLLDCYGIPVADSRLVASPSEAGAAADELGGRVALKAVATGVVRKRDAQAVALGLAGAAEVERRAESMTRDLAAAGHRVERLLVQRMVPPGVEVLVGVVHDRLFGPVIACGAGDSEMELLKDVAVRITPLTDRDADEMLRSLVMFPLLEGYRSASRSDVAALEQVLLRVSAMVEAHPEIVEMDCNPVIVLPEGAVVVDARVRIEALARR
ncbi:MAG TPA: acetate--CoA ligase family protein, partial [Candidatus Limnocylindrales bacterium]